MSNEELAQSASLKPRSRSEVESAVRQLLKSAHALDSETVNGIKMDEHGVLANLGINSLEVFELIVTLEERFGFEFDDEELNPDLVDPLDRLVSSVCTKLKVKE